MKKRLTALALAVLMLLLTACDTTQGPQGEPGIQGEQGIQGIQGEQGLPGEKGQDGQDGKDGKDGQNGLTPFIGSNGNWWIGETDTGISATGPQGEKGDTGATGATGAQGPQGEKGDTGATGATGAQGPQGEKGDTGATGATGAQGPQGEKGDTGATGATGAQGPQGEKGDTGATGATGAQGPQGEKGDTGATGATGAQGPQGEKGDTGATGATGAQGPQGEKGDTGATGATGAQGPQGEKGDTGATGPQGPQGIGIVDSYIDENSHLIFVMSDGSLIDAGVVTIFCKHTVVIDEAVPATCTSDGLTEGTHCSLCNTVLIAQDKVDAFGHTEVIDHAVDPTCSATGLTEGKHCSLCNDVLISQTVIDVLPHTEVIDDAVPATCTETGLTEGKHCSVCSKVLIRQETVKALGHTCVESNITTQPTCTQTGVLSYTCTVCQQPVTEDIDMLPHNISDEWTVDEAPGCNKAGSKSHHCTKCDYKTDITVMPTVHQYENNICTLCYKHAPTQGLLMTPVNNGTAYEVGGIGSATDTHIVIPDFYNGLPVIQIGDNAFENNASITHVDIPNTVTKIGSYAFYACIALEEIFIPDSVQSIGTYAFYYCSAMTTAHTGNNVTTISYGAFENCTALKDLTLGSNLKYIETNAFKNCSSLLRLSVPSGVSLANNPFNGHLFDYVSFEGDLKGSTFFICSKAYNAASIEQWIAIARNSSFDYVDEDVTGFILYINGVKLTKLTITPAMGDFGSAFSYCSSLVSVTYAEGVTHTGYFGDCKNLMEISFSDSVAVIDRSSFSWFSSLKTVIIGNGVTTIKDDAFYRCELENIYIPKNVTTIEDYAISGSWDKKVNIYAEALVKPVGWADDFYSDGTVTWNYPMGNHIYQFETNGGSEVADMECLIISSRPYTEKEGYLLVGWYTNTECTGNPVEFPYVGKKDTTFYAKWVEKPQVDQGEISVYDGTSDTTWYTGTETEYTLTNAAQAMGFFELRAQGERFAGITVKLGCNVIFNVGSSAEEVKAIATPYLAPQSNSSYHFQGTFDGQGHYMSGVYMQLTNSAVKGMFGTLGHNASIQNLTIQNSYFGGPTASGKNRYGVISPMVSGSNVTLTNVHVIGVLMEDANGYVDHVGGLIGRVQSNGSVTLDGCTVSGTMDLPYSQNIGGLIGYTLGGTVLIRNCHTDVQINALINDGALIGLMDDPDKVTISYT